MEQDTTQDHETAQALASFFDTKMYGASGNPAFPDQSQLDFIPVGSDMVVKVDNNQAAVCDAAGFHCAPGVQMTPLLLDNLLSSDYIEMPKDFGVNADVQGPKVSGPAFIPKMPGLD